MSTMFIGHNIWPQLTKAVRGSKQRCDVAVAYCGAGASRMLPLPKGSCLVVDASEGAVTSSQTCPEDLQRLMNNDVAVYSVPNLHAKVYVLGRTAYVGSANVSHNSANRQVESIIRTTEPSAVRAARKFVKGLCLHELTPEVVKRLAKLYRPPRIPGGKKGKRQQKGTSAHPIMPRLFLAQLEFEKWSDRDLALHDKAIVVAKKRRKHPRSYKLESFRVTGACGYQRGNVVIQVTDEGRGNVLVTPQGNVLHVRTRRDGKRRVSFVYLERPDLRRRHVKSLARSLGCAKKKLLRDGQIRNPFFKQALLNVWASTP